MSGGPEVRSSDRQQLAEALELHRLAAFTGEEVLCYCDNRWRTNADYREHQRDTLLPVVDRIAAERAAEALQAAAKEQRAEADQVPWDDEGTHADGHRCAAWFLDRRAEAMVTGRQEQP